MVNDSPFFLIALGTLTLLNFSPSALAAIVAESKENRPSAQVLQTEESQQSKQKSEGASNLRLDFLTPHILAKIANSLSRKDAENLAQVSKHCFGALSSHSNLELSLENKTLTEEDFLSRFGEHGLYKKARCISLSRSSLHPAWLRYLPNTVKALKLRAVKTNSFSEYGFEDPLAMRMEMLRVLGETLPGLKFLDIAQNSLGASEAEPLAQLSSLNSLDIGCNRLGDAGAKHITQLSSLNSLDISCNQLGAEGARLIAEHLSSLTSWEIVANEIGNEVKEEIRKKLPLCQILDKGLFD